MPVMYHVTSGQNRTSILKKGLLADLDNTGYGAIFLADSPPLIIPGLDVWAVEVSGLSLDEDFTGEPDDGRWWMHYGDIRPDRLSMRSGIPTPALA
jgi:hypothetical protein